MDKPRYKSIIVNSVGVDGKSYAIDSNKMEINLAPVARDMEGTNPEQLIAFSWAACLNSTIKSLLRNKEGHESKVVIEVTLNNDKPVGLYFQLNAKAAISGMSIDEADKIIVKAHAFCPVSKLISASKTVTLTTVDYSEIANL